jgi:hypothetical protein
MMTAFQHDRAKLIVMENHYELGDSQHALPGHTRRLCISVNAEGMGISSFST